MSMSMSMTKEPPLLFFSLPNDIVVNVVARVPRRYYPILSCVSKKMRSLIRFSELHKTRSLMGKDCFYVCFEEIIYPSKTYHWFTLTEDRRLVSIRFPSPPEPPSAVLMVGPEIYFVGGNCYQPMSMWILDSRSRKLRQGPSSLVATGSSAVGLVDEKIYIFGGFENNRDREIQAQVFDLKTQTWQVAPNPSSEVQTIWVSVVTPSLHRKIYVRNSQGIVRFYDPRDGKCERIDVPYDDFYSKDLCVIDNVLYSYYLHVGLMWYNSKKKEWRVVCGLKLEGDLWNVVMTEYNGKLAFLWPEEQDKTEIWCTMIALCWDGIEIQGSVEWSDCILFDVPPRYDIKHYLGRTD